MKKKRVKLIARMLCIILAMACISVPVVSYAADVETIVHSSNVRNWGNVPSSYNLNTASPINGIAYRVIQIDATTSIYDMKSAMLEVYNGGGTDYFKGFSTTSEANDLIVALENKNPGGDMSVYITADGKTAPVVSQDIIWVNTGNAGPLSGGSSTEDRVNKYLARLMYGTVHQSSSDAAYEDEIFDYLMNKWCNNTKNEAAYSAYKSYMNAPGSPRYYMIELYYVSGSYSGDKTILGSALSSLKMSGVQNADVWKNSMSTTDANSDSISDMAYDKYLNLSKPSMESDDRLLQLNSAIKYWANSSHRIGGNGNDNVIPGTVDYYGRGLLVPYTNSSKIGAPSTVKAITGDDIRFSVSKTLTSEYYTNIGYSYNNLDIRIDRSSNNYSKLLGLISAASYSELSAEEQNKIKNIQLKITVTPEAGADAFVSGWQLDAALVAELLGNKGWYPVLDSMGGDYAEIVNGKKVYQKLVTDQFSGDTRFTIGTTGSAITYVTTLDEFPSAGIIEPSNGDWVNGAYGFREWNHSDLQYYDSLNLQSALDHNYGVGRYQVLGYNSIKDPVYKLAMWRYYGIVKDNSTGIRYAIHLQDPGKVGEFTSSGVRHDATIMATPGSGSEDYLDYSRFDSNDYSRFNFSEVRGSINANDIVKNRADYSLNNKGFETEQSYLTSYTLTWNFSTQEFTEFLNSGGIKCCIQSSKTKTNYHVSGSIAVRGNRNIVDLTEGTTTEMPIVGCDVESAEQSDANTVSKWAFSTPSNPKVYAEIKANNNHNEDWDVMSGIPTTENLYVGIGADQYRINLSGGIFVIGTPKRFNGSMVANPANYHISGEVPIGYDYGLTSGYLPSTIGQYDTWLSIVSSTDPLGNRGLERTAGYPKDPVTGVKIYGTVDTNNQAIYRIIRLNTFVVGYWGNNQPCQLLCGGHSIFGETWSCSSSGEGNPGACTNASAVCGVCGGNHHTYEETKTCTDTSPSHVHQSSCFTWKCTGTCDSTASFNCKTGTIAPGGTTPPSISGTANPPDDSTFNQHWWVPSLKATVGNKSYNTTEVHEQDLIDDGWTVAGSYGCSCNPVTNMNHGASHMITNWIYETYDMYVTQTIENWEVYSFIGATVTDMDSTLFKDTVAGNKEYGLLGNSDESGYYAVSTRPFGMRLWKTGVLYNGWVKQWADEPVNIYDKGIDQTFGRDDLIAQVGIDDEWVEKRNGRIIFSGTDTLYGWDGTDDTADYKCPLCVGRRDLCIYHSKNLGKCDIKGKDHYTTNYWNDNIGDQKIELCVAYDSEFLKERYSNAVVHGDPANSLMGATNCAGIEKHYVDAFGKYAANVAWSDSSNPDCWAYKTTTGYSSRESFYFGDIQAAGCPNHTSNSATAYAIDGLNLFCRYNGFQDGNINGTEYGYSAFCISDTLDTGYMEVANWMYEEPELYNNQMIIDHGYRIGNNINIYGSDFTGPDQAHVYNHYSQWSVDQIKYSMVQCWIGDNTNPMAGAPRRHIDNVGNYIYSTGYTGSQSGQKYGDLADEFHSADIMTLRGQYMRRDHVISVFEMAGSSFGMSSYTGHGDSDSDYGNGDRSGYYPQCYTRQGTEAEVRNPETYKYGNSYVCYITTSDATTTWSHPGYWANYPSLDWDDNDEIKNDWVGAESDSDNHRNHSLSKVKKGYPLEVYKSVTSSNNWHMVVWNMTNWDTGHIEWEYEGDAPEGATKGIHEFYRLKKYMEGAPGSPWQYYNIRNMLNPNTGGDNYKVASTLAFYPSDSSNYNMLVYGDYCYGMINGITMWPYAPNGVYSNPVTVKVNYYPFAKSTERISAAEYPMLTWKGSSSGSAVSYQAGYTGSYINEQGIQYDVDIPTTHCINDIVVHNPVSAEYSTVISNGMTGVNSSEISGFIDESGKDMRYGQSNVSSVSIGYSNYEDLEEWQKHDYWVIGNTCNIWISDLGDFNAKSSTKTRNLVQPTIELGVNKGVSGTLKHNGEIHINNLALRYNENGTKSGIDYPGGKGYADAMLTSQWIYGRYVKFPVPVTFESNDTTYVVERDTWINLNLCTPTSTGGTDGAPTSGLSLIMDKVDNANNKFEYTKRSYMSGTHKLGDLVLPIDPQVPGMVSCNSYKNFYNGSSDKPYNGDVDKQFEYGLNYSFRILASADECVDGTVEFFSMAINDLVNFDKIANGETLTDEDVQASVDALVFRQASNIGRTDSARGQDIESKYDRTSFRRYEYQDGYRADSGAYKYAKVDIVGRIGNLALEDVADFRYSNLFKQVKSDGSWLIEGVIRATDPTVPLTIGAEPYDIYGYKVGEQKDATDGTTKIIVSHSVYNISRYTGVINVTSELSYPNGNSGKLDIVNGMNYWFQLPLTPKNNNVDEYKTQAMKLGYDAFFDIETVGNYYGNNGNNEGPSKWDTSRADYGDTRKQVMTIIPHYFLYDYMTGVWEDDIKIWYGEQNNYTLCYDNGKTIADDTSGLYQDIMKEGHRRNVSGIFDYSVSDNPYSEGGLTRIAQSLKSPTNNFDINALGSGTRWIGNSSRIVLDGYDRNFIGSWMFYQKADGQGYDSTLGTKALKGITPDTEYQSKLDWGLADADFSTQSQRWYFKIGLPSSSYITTSTFLDPDTHTVKDIITGDSINQAGIVYSHEQLQQEHPHSVLICYLDITVVGEVYTLKYVGFHGSDKIEIFDPSTPDKPGKPEDDPDTPPWTPPHNEVPKDPTPDPDDPSNPPAEPPWEPVVTYDPWDNSATDLATYGTH